MGITFEAGRELVWIFSLSGRERADLKAGVNNSLDSSWNRGKGEAGSRLEALEISLGNLGRQSH